MYFIAHRINSVESLKKIPRNLGVEVDLRDYHDRLVLAHDPFSNGDDFERYLKYFKHQFLVLNIKSERIEYRVLELLKKYRIKNYFFLDSSFPMIYALTKKRVRNIAVRFSEIESLNTVLALKKKVQWVWVDCFTKVPLTQKDYRILKKNQFKLCLTSPDLLGREQDIEKYKKYFQKEKIVFDAICSKIDNLHRWE